MPPHVVLPVGTLSPTPGATLAAARE